MPALTEHTVHIQEYEHTVNPLVTGGLEDLKIAVSPGWEEDQGKYPPGYYKG